ncbi:GNAT family N-acetyltransferase [Erythrobacter sp. R86502]|uniref:GNAT family N-acetyltransferase n=1 Tax=Erythrobacter sp. R86502 TaxID=3093846 RepID=UPI0036D2B2EF
MARADSFRTRSTAFARIRSRPGDLQMLTTEEMADPVFVSAWQRLVACAAEPNPFFEPWFLRPAMDQWATADQVVATAWYDNGQLAALLPVNRSLHYYGHVVPHAKSWLHPNAFCGVPLIAAGHEDAFWRAMLSYLDRQAGRALFWHLPLLPADGPVNAALSRVLAATPRTYYTAAEESRAVLTGPMCADDYLETSMSAKKRKELRRQHNRLTEEGALIFERLDDASSLAAWTAEFLALEAAGWKGAAGSALASAPDTYTLFVQALAGAAAEGRLERLALRLNGRAIAMLVNFVTPPGVYSFKTAFDENYARFSPGMLLQLENLSLLDRSDVQWADSCAAEGHPMIERLWRDKRRMVSRNIAIGGLLRRTAFRLLMAYETRSRKLA